MNNTPDYNDNLAFEPKLTWRDLKEFAKQYTFYYPHVTRDDFFIGLLLFRSNGEIRANGVVIADNRSYEQMKNIIDTLGGGVEMIESQDELLTKINEVLRDE